MKNDVDIYDIAKNYPIASNSIIFIVILAILWTKITQSADIYVDIYKLSNSSPEEWWTGELELEPRSGSTGIRCL